jgi:hypothetical protein
MEHHNLDPYPEPREKAPLYVNEPWHRRRKLANANNYFAERNALGGIMFC